MTGKRLIIRNTFLGFALLVVCATIGFFVWLYRSHPEYPRKPEYDWFNEQSMTSNDMKVAVKLIEKQRSSQGSIYRTTITDLRTGEIFQTELCGIRPLFLCDDRTHLFMANHTHGCHLSSWNYRKDDGPGRVIMCWPDNFLTNGNIRGDGLIADVCPSRPSKYVLFLIQPGGQWNCGIMSSDRNLHTEFIGDKLYVDDNLNCWLFDIPPPSTEYPHFMPRYLGLNMFVRRR